MDDDKTQRHAKYTIIAFCGTVMLSMILFSWLSGGMMHVGFWHFVGAFLLGGVVGGATFAAAHVLEL